jgi:hypothetical protein
MTASNGMGDPEALRTEIQQTRADLGQSVQALAARADVKARLKEQTAQKRQHLREQAGQRKEHLREQAGQQKALAQEAATRAMGAARNSARHAGGNARRHPVPVAVAGVAAVVVIFLAIRGRRR